MNLTLNDKSPANILVVDDNEVNCELLRLRLGVEGYQVTSVCDGRKALEVLRPRTAFDSHHADDALEYDLLLLDIMMPEISGVEVLRKLRLYYTRADLPIIMVTARDDPEDYVEALRAGANDYVTKPIDFAILIARIEAALQLKQLTRQKDEFLAIASHDLKNPLSVVRGFIRMVKMLVPPGEAMTEEAIDMLHRSEAQTGIMERIISDYLDFQAMEAGQLMVAVQPLELEPLVRMVLDTMDLPARQKSITLDLSVDSDLPTATADPARVEQVLQNLIGNAIKFMKPGGKVEVRLQKTNDCVRIEIQDEGPGIPDDEMPRLFMKYARISNHPTGGEKSSGMGLAISRKIIELHAGEIGAQNNSGRPGTTFWFTLPCTAPPPQNRVE